MGGAPCPTLGATCPLAGWKQQLARGEGRGGHHRSVAIAEQVAEYLRAEDDIRVEVEHPHVALPVVENQPGPLPSRPRPPLVSPGGAAAARWDATPTR